MGAIQKDHKEQNRSVSYEDISSRLEDRADLSYIIDEDIIDYKKVVIKLTTDLEEFVEKEDLNDNERKLGYALIEVFSNFDLIILKTSSQDAFSNFPLYLINGVSNL